MISLTSLNVLKYGIFLLITDLFASSKTFHLLLDSSNRILHAVHNDRNNWSKLHTRMEYIVIEHAINEECKFVLFWLFLYSSGRKVWSFCNNT